MRSCLDLAIASASLAPFVTKVVIDKEKRITTRRVIRRAGRTVTIFSDHYAVEVKI